MKINLSLVLLLNLSYGFSQQQIPVLKSNTPQVKIIENGELITDWNLDPRLDPDIYTTGKNFDSRTIKMVTDIDSVEVNLKYNETFDVAVLFEDHLYNTRFQSPELKNYSSVIPTQQHTIPFTLSVDNNIQVTSLLNNKDSIPMLFDSGASGFYLLKTAIKKYLNPTGKKITMKDISDNHFTISDLEWEHEQIYPLETTGYCCEGMFGWTAFDGKVVAIDYDTNVMTVYTKRPEISTDYEAFAIEYMKEHFCINVEIASGDKKYSGRFLFDTGYQRTAMLDPEMISKTGFPIDVQPVIQETIMYNSRNEAIPVKTVATEQLIFGRYVLENVPAQINNYNKPAGYSTNLLGNEVLKRFNIILDFQNHVVYLKPNHLFHEKYAESTKS